MDVALVLLHGVVNLEVGPVELIHLGLLEALVFGTNGEALDGCLLEGGLTSLHVRGAISHVGLWGSGNFLDVLVGREPLKLIVLDALVLGDHDFVDWLVLHRFSRFKLFPCFLQNLGRRLLWDGRILNVSVVKSIWGVLPCDTLLAPMASTGEHGLVEWTGAPQLFLYSWVPKGRACRVDADSFVQIDTTLTSRYIWLERPWGIPWVFARLGLGVKVVTFVLLEHVDEFGLVALEEDVS